MLKLKCKNLRKKSRYSYKKLLGACVIMERFTGIEKFGLYNPEYEKDSCGVGFVANLSGEKDHSIIIKGLTVLKNLVHRGAIGGDLKTGDGAGILLQIPHQFFQKELKDVELGEERSYGVAMLFLSQEDEKAKKCLTFLKESIEEAGATWIAERKVPINPDCLGEIALSGLPEIHQVFIKHSDMKDDALERKMFLIRKMTEYRARQAGYKHIDFYIPSLSCKTIVYKGFLTAHQTEEFYPDLSDEDFKSSLALVHQRYSTNTFPTWALAQPFRYLAHNGEINTIRGNINKMKAREYTMTSDLFGDDLKNLFPVVDNECSDSGMFDNSFEFLVNAGRGIEHAIMMMVPEAFGIKYHMSADKRAFYEYHATFMEPWDGPAALVFTDGTKIGATLDRNGLRPCRFTITKDGFVVLASETGVLEIEPENVLKKGRLEPGKIFLVDTVSNRVIDDIEVKASVSRRKPYRKWLNKNKIELKSLFNYPHPVKLDEETILQRQMLFGYTYEDIKLILEPMAVNGQEPVNSMGRDKPLAVLSQNPKLLFDYFKQLFAQVTNPAIDPLREGLVMSLMSFIGREGDLLKESPEHCKRLKLKHPILTNEDLESIRSSKHKFLQAKTISILFKADGGGEALEKALDELFKKASDEIRNGASVIILSDRGATKEYAPIPILLAASGLHHHLIRNGLRSLAGIVCETGEAREVMHFALLSGYGVNAINPYLAFETLSMLHKRDFFPPEIDVEDVVDNYITAIKKGLLKIFSKLGISTIRSYNAAQNFEAVGVSTKVIEKYFTGTASRIEGVTLNEIAEDASKRHYDAFIEEKIINMLKLGAEHRYRVKTEEHLWNPFTISMLQKATKIGDYELYQEFAKYVNEQAGRLCTLRGIFKFKDCNPIPIEEVEPVEEIYKRFVTGAMSFGAMSYEAHTTLAAAMNEIGGKSNSGEGGEDRRRYDLLEDGTNLRSEVKQVASGRFGVTNEYLVNCREIQIKIAQGAKPGEGGQLPGHKVNKTIASVRYTMPGVTLISPPPHHDIYSIEDIAQLIWDLHNINPEANVSVKLVSEVGVGTVAAGVAKGKSDIVLISGGDGGTGASPLSSIHHAGLPWELGLAETQQTLVNNHLRDKIRVQVDGQMRTGRDVIVAGLLGAEEFGFATSALVVIGCIMMRKCHQNTCPVGINTQREELRKRFTGKPEYVVNYFKFIAQEVRELMAELGFKTFAELVGRVDKLAVNTDLLHSKAKTVDFSGLFDMKYLEGKDLFCTTGQIHDYSKILDKTLIEKSQPAIDRMEVVKFETKIHNSDRAVGAMLSGKVAKKYRYEGLKEDTIDITFKGSAGQSFGAFLARGITFRVYGDANDYMGKGLSGGKIIVMPPEESTFIPQDNIIVGNTLLYGATGGEVYIRGVAGERFGVRNSGAMAVVEGVGDHCCEYMTGGVVVVLGKTGRNFAAGMSGGIAFVLDENHLFDTLCNLDMVDIEPIIEEKDKELLKTLIQNHYRNTGSANAKKILDEWREIFPKFIKVMPMEYKKALELQRQEEERDTESVPLTEEVFEING